MRGNPGSHRIVSERTATAGSGNAEPPLLIHLLLDEHIGVEGLPPEIPGTRALRPELIDFYTSRGFRLFGGAYSQYANTYNSIANLLNFASREVSRPYLSHGGRGRVGSQGGGLFPDASAARLSLARVSVQSTWTCVMSMACSCRSARHIRSRAWGCSRSWPCRAFEKARAIANAIVTQSNVLLVVNKVYERNIRATLLRAGVQMPAWRWQGPLFGPLPVPDVFERIGDDILRHPRGHAFFAHLLLPHYPYVFDRRCELRSSTSDWLTNHIVVHRRARLQHGGEPGAEVRALRRAGPLRAHAHRRPAGRSREPRPARRCDRSSSTAITARGFPCTFRAA